MGFQIIANNLAISSKIKHNTIQQLHSLAFNQEELKLMFTQKSVCQCSQQFTISKTETIQMFFIRQMVKQTVVHLYHGLLLSNKKEWPIDT